MSGKALGGLIGLTLSALAPLSHATDAADLDYTGSVEFRPEAGAMVASWTIRIFDPDLETISFALNSSFGAAQVTGDAVEAVQVSPDPRFDGAVQLYAIDLEPASGDKPRRVRFAYGGRLFAEDPPYPINTLDPDKIELTVDSFWFPFDARFDSAITANLGVRVPGDWSGVGVETVEPVPQGFRIRQDRPGLDIAFSLLSSSNAIARPGYVIHDARTEKGAKIDELVAVLESCTTYLNRLAGPAGPLPQASIIVTNRSDGGYSRGTLIALTDIEGDDEESLRQFICHELSHYWSHANAGGPENWINEGVADYLANMALRDALGEAVFAARMQRYAEQLAEQELPPIWTPEATERPPHAVMYRAAPITLMALEEKMGREAFAAFMRAVMIERVKDTPELLALLERDAGVEIRDWFEARLARTGWDKV